MIWSRAAELHHGLVQAMSYHSCAYRLLCGNNSIPIILRIHKRFVQVLLPKSHQTVNSIYLADVSPFVTEQSVSCRHKFLFLVCPRITPNVWPQLIMPSFSALFANAPRKCFGNGAPTSFSKLAYQPAKKTRQTLSQTAFH